jgi:hypothetical protein
MIDFIINEAGGVTVAHTLKALDAYVGLGIDPGTGTVTMTGPGGDRSIGTLQPSMLAALRPGMQARAVRTSGWSIAKVTPLTLCTLSRVVN